MEAGGRPECDWSLVIGHWSFAPLPSLPIEALRLPNAVVQSLHDLDLRTIGQLEALPRCTLPARFGPVLLQRLDQLFGRRPETFTPERDAGPIEAEWVFEEPVRDRRALEIVLGRLIEQIVARLEPRGEGVVRLDCLLVESRGSRAERPRDEHRAAPPCSGSRLTLSLARPTRSLRHLCELARLQLERLALPAEVAAINVRVTAAAPLESRQLELFATDAARDRRRRVAALVERLSSRLGERSVLQPRLVADFQPEFAVAYEPLLGQQTFRFTEPEKRRARRGSPTHAEHATLDHRSSIHSSSSSILHPPSSAPTPHRPLRLLTAPAHVQATSIVPDGPPIRFPWRGREHRVRRWWGPERIETGWWRSPHVRRDYYRVETSTGEQFWLFRERLDGEWFVQGLFE